VLISIHKIDSKYKTVVEKIKSFYGAGSLEFWVEKYPEFYAESTNF